MVESPGRLPLSYSRLLAWTCRYRFWSLYIAQKAKEVPALPLLRGALIADAIDQWTRLGFGEVEAMRVVLKGLWLERDAGIPEDEHQEVERMLVDFARRNEGGFPHLYGSEVEVALTDEAIETTWWAKDVFWRAKLDRVDAVNQTTIRVVDYKSGYSDAVDPFQLETYAMAIFATLRTVQTVEVVFDFVRLGFKSEPVVFDRSHGFKTWSRIIAISDQIEKERHNPKKRTDVAWPAVPCTDCGYCELRCPRAGELLTGDSPMGPVQTDAEAQAALADLVLHQAKAGQLRRRLKAWAGVRGEVTAAGKTVGYTTTEAWNVDLYKLFELAEEAGLGLRDLLPILKPPGKEEMDDWLKRGPRSLAPLLPAMDRFRSQTTAWTERKAAGDE